MRAGADMDRLSVQQNSALLLPSSEMNFRRKWLLIVSAIALVALVAIALFLAEAPASLQFIGYGTDATGLLLLSNRTDRDLDFDRRSIEVREADAWATYVQNYTIRSHLLAPHQSIVLRVELPDGRFTWKATATGVAPSKLSADANALLRRVGIKWQLRESEFRTSVIVPRSNYRSETNAVIAPSGVLEVIRVRPTDKGGRNRK